MKLLKYLALVTTVGMSLSAAQAADKDAKISAGDRAWAHMSAVSDKMEITLAKAAQEKAQNPQLKQHAQKMIQDHQKTTDTLMAWAKQNDVSLNADLPKEKEAVVDEITAKSGAEFDKAYLDAEVKHHRMAAVHFQNGAEFAYNPELKSFAQQNLPTIQQHLQEVEQMKGSGSGLTSAPGQGHHQHGSNAAAATSSGSTASAPSSSATSGQAPASQTGVRPAGQGTSGTRNNGAVEAR